jgi:excisionase family DNA binding protein
MAIELYTTREVARMLGLSPATVRMWVWQGRIPVVRLRRAVRISRADLDALVARSREEASYPLHHTAGRLEGGA